MKQIAYLSSAYLAPVSYYRKLLTNDEIYIEQFDHYMKQTYRNRCQIVSPNGVQTLTIPTERSESPKCLMRDVRISDHGNWRHLHWNAFEAAYGQTPFFIYYADDFRPFYERKMDFLIDFNEELLHMVCSLIGIDPKIRRTESYKTEPWTDNETDYREIIHPKKDFRTEDPSFTPHPYYQVFDQRHGFIPNMSIVDLLFNMGPESLIVLNTP